ncbi:MAG: S41 family peptidase [Butyrivibrio sp.]
MDYEEQRKQYKKGMKTGILIGGGIILVVALMAMGLITSLLYVKLKAGSGNSLIIGENTVSKANSLIEYINKYYLYDYDEEDMENAIYDAIFESLGDPYSCYYTTDEYKELMESSEGVYCGIGVVVQQDVETGYIKVVQPYKNAPGAEAGIKEGDIITAVGGKDICNVDIDLVVKDIRGEEGTYVDITVDRNGETLEFRVERRMVNVVTVEYEMLEDKTGYIQIAQFDGVTLKQVEEALENLKEQGMKSLIIDVRNNPGGRLDVVTNILDFFIDKGDLIVYTQDKNGKRTDYKANKDPVINVPCVVLVNGNSASASEIFAGALQDYKLAHIMGTQSFGKGIVQSIIPMMDGTAFKITVEDYYTPNGNNIHGIGITPDTVVELDADAYQNDGTDSQLDAAMEYLNK